MNITDLAFFLGQWELKSKYLDPSGNWIDNPDGEASFVYILEDMGIEENATFYFQGRKFVTRTLMGFDAARGLFRFAILDNQHGFLDVHEGALDERRLTLSNVNSGTSFIREGSKYFYKVIYELKSPNHIQMTIFLQREGEESWTSVNVTDYLRK